MSGCLGLGVHLEDAEADVGGGDGGSETVSAIESEGGHAMKSAFPAPTGRNVIAQGNTLVIKS
jgi:hypothetical protein